MNDYPPVTIVMTTYFPEGSDGRHRRDVASHALYSWEDNLGYKGQLRIHIADDGSYCDFKTDWEYVTYTRQERMGVGSSLNKGIQQAFEVSDFVLHAVDDWLLVKEFDLTPWVRVLLEREDIGLVRLGPPHPHIIGQAECLIEGIYDWGLILKRKYYAFATRPFLLHKRFIDAYGWFEEGKSAVEVERLYNERFCSMSGPDIVYALPHFWEHAQSISMSEIEPGRE